MDNILIIGSSGHAKVVIDIVEQKGKYNILGLIDPHIDVGECVLGYKILGKDEDLIKICASNNVNKAIVAIGDNYIRSKAVSNIQNICSSSLMFVSAVHPRANIGKDVHIGKGSVVMAGVSINSCSSIGEFCVLNTNSSIDHDSCMGSFASLAPNVATGGNCKIGDYSSVNIGATIMQNINIGDNTIIGAGATVLNDIESNKLVYGTPAKIIRDINIRHW